MHTKRDDPSRSPRTSCAFRYQYKPKIADSSFDSGSGHDLISARKAERMNLKKRTCDPIMFHTANGSTATQTEAEIDLGTFDMTSQAYVLDDTPSVMSLGKRCMEEGYSFVWPSGKMPFMVTKNGERIDLTIHDNIPYIDLGTYECTPYECCHASKIQRST